MNKKTTKSSKAAQPLVASHFQDALVLNQWVITLLGVDPLAAHTDAGRNKRPLEVLAKTLREIEPGISPDGKHRFAKALTDHLQAGAVITTADIERYDANLVAHTRWINERRKHKGPIVWKYFQWLTLLFVEIYIDRYFSDRQGLCDALNEYLNRPLKKCFSNASGTLSAKTRAAQTRLRSDCNGPSEPVRNFVCEA